MSITHDLFLIVAFDSLFHSAIKKSAQGFALRRCMELNDFFFALGNAKNDTVNLFGVPFCCSPFLRICWWHSDSFL